jgi:hypothetical protein
MKRNSVWLLELYEKDKWETILLDPFENKVKGNEALRRVRKWHKGLKYRLVEYIASK